MDPRATFADFAAHITQTIQTHPQAGWIFVTDQLNTHQSEALVHLVAEQCGIQEELGLKGKSGHLANMSTRAAFLSNTSHRIRARLHSQTQLLAQPDGDLVLSPCSSLAFPAQLPLCAGVAYPHPGLYCLLQSHVQWGLSTSPTKDLLPVSRLLRYFREAVLVSCYQQV